MARDKYVVETPYAKGAAWPDRPRGGRSTTCETPPVNYSPGTSPATERTVSRAN